MKLLLPGALRSYAPQLQFELPQAEALNAQGLCTLDSLFDALDRRHPGLRFRVVDEQGLLRANMRIFVNGLGVRDLQHALAAEDLVAVVLALSGG